MDEIWLKQGDHFAVKRFDERDDVGILYQPEGSQMVSSGDAIVLDEAGVYRVGSCVAVANAEVFPDLDLSGVTATAIADSAQAEVDLSIWKSAVVQELGKVKNSKKSEKSE